jgi:hypothetical protein
MRTHFQGLARAIALATLLVRVAPTAAAQSAPDAPSSSSIARSDPVEAVVAIGVVLLDPGTDAAAAAPASMAGRPANICGSGFFVSKQGDIVTALHVLRSAEKAREQAQGVASRLFVGLRNGGSFFPIPAEVIGADEAHDLALLRIKTRAAVTSVVKLSSARPEDGALIEAAGMPAMTGLALVTNPGHLSDDVLLRPGNLNGKSPDPSASKKALLATQADIDAAHRLGWDEFYLADAKSDEGMSGGPAYLVDNRAVIGVVQGYTQDPRLAVLVPARYVIDLLKSNGVAYEEFQPGPN